MNEVICSEGTLHWVILWYFGENIFSLKGIHVVLSVLSYSVLCCLAFFHTSIGCAFHETLILFSNVWGKLRTRANSLYYINYLHRRDMLNVTHTTYCMTAASDLFWQGKSVSIFSELTWSLYSCSYKCFKVESRHTSVSVTILSSWKSITFFLFSYQGSLKSIFSKSVDIKNCF